MTTIRGGLIQMRLKAPTDKSPAQIAKAMLDAHVPLIEKAGKAGVQNSVLSRGVHPTLFLSEPGFKMVCGGRADPGRVDSRAHAGACEEARHGDRRPDL